MSLKNSQMSKEEIKQQVEEKLAQAEAEKRKLLQIIKEAIDGVLDIDKRSDEIRKSLI